LVATFPIFISLVFGLKYIAGYVAFRFKDKYKLGDPTNKVSNIGVPDWLQFISRGNLLQPNNNLFQAALVLEKEFQSINGNGFPNERFIFRKLSEKTIAHYEVIACLSRTRTYIRLRSGFWKHFIWPVS
jgi:hypothetical protein